MHWDLERSLRPRALLVVLLLSGCTFDSHEAPLRAAAQAAPSDAPPDTGPAVGVPGALAGTTVWRVPATASGLVPNQSWFSLAGTPDGSVFVSGCDHRTNTALYRVTPDDDRLTYVGDARSASEAARNWRVGETAEKFHVRPLWYQGRLYMGTADYSNQDDGYLARRGFHWYGFDPARGLADLSAREPGGVAAEHISLFATTLDEVRGYVYGLGSPTAHLYRYEIATGVTTDLGRPPELTRPYYNPGRFLWVDREGVVYFTVGNAGVVPPGEAAAPRHVLSWSPREGFVARTDWPIAEMLRTGQWSRDGQRLYVLDYPLNLYVFDAFTQTFAKLGQGVLGPEHGSPRTGAVRVRAAHLSANEKKLYFVNDTAPVSALWEWSFHEGTPPRLLSEVARLDARLDPARYTAATGHDAWDADGRFYFTSFGGEAVPPTPDLYLLRVDPVRLKAALGLLPGVPVVTVQPDGAGGQRLVRSGDASGALSVILEHTADPRPVYHVTLPAGITSLRLRDAPGPVRVVPDGDTYVVR